MPRSTYRRRDTTESVNGSSRSVSSEVSGSRMPSWPRSPRPCLDAQQSVSQPSRKDASSASQRAAANSSSAGERLRRRRRGRSGRCSNNPSVGGHVQAGVAPPSGASTDSRLTALMWTGRARYESSIGSTRRFRGPCPRHVRVIPADSTPPMAIGATRRESEEVVNR